MDTLNQLEMRVRYAALDEARRSNFIHRLYHRGFEAIGNSLAFVTPRSVSEHHEVLRIVISALWVQVIPEMTIIQGLLKVHHNVLVGYRSERGR
jgi:hypothetical protein